MTVTVIEGETPAAASDNDGAIIDAVVEARVEAAQATEDAAEAVEAVEQIADVVEGTLEWQMSQLSELRQSMTAMAENFTAELNQLREAVTLTLASIPPPNLESPEQSSLTPPDMTESVPESEAEEVAEDPAEMTEETTLETTTEQFVETKTEALAKLGHEKLSMGNLRRWLQSPVFSK